VVSHLDLSGNCIDQEGGVAIGEMLKENYTITYINLANNKLGALGGRAIAKAIGEDNSTVKTLVLNGNVLWRTIRRLNNAFI
jgi:Ran GTPase-activating protein (RanGAP) involved in mRNA processing and transport